MEFEDFTALLNFLKSRLLSVGQDMKVLDYVETHQEDEQVKILCALLMIDVHSIELKNEIERMQQVAEEVNLGYSKLFATSG